MLIKQVKKLTPMERLLYFIEERESVRLKKEAGMKKPWTDDMILQQFRFCNVRRMDDRVSKWLLDNWYEPNRGHKMMLVNVALARFINQPTTLEHIGFQKSWDPIRLKDKLRVWRNTHKIFNAAYMVRGDNGVDKVVSVVDYNIGSLIKAKIVIDIRSMQYTWEQIKDVYGFGSFTAGQVVADLRWAMPGTWEDKHDWAPRGPGSQKGLALLLGMNIKTKFDPKDFCYELILIQEHVEQQLPKIAKRLELHDIQNCMCEYFKYTKTLAGIGRPKQLYNGLE